MAEFLTVIPPKKRISVHLLVGPVLCALVTVLFVVPLLLVNSGHGYRCRGSAIGDVINPEPQDSALFRRDFFDSGRACNRQARRQVAGAAVIAGIGGVTTAVWARRRARRPPSD